MSQFYNFKSETIFGILKFFRFEWCQLEGLITARKIYIVVLELENETNFQTIMDINSVDFRKKASIYYKNGHMLSLKNAV